MGKQAKCKVFCGKTLRPSLLQQRIEEPSAKIPRQTTTKISMKYQATMLGLTEYVLVVIDAECVTS